jgi:hypothetical protein
VRHRAATPSRCDRIASQPDSDPLTTPTCAS